MRRAIVVLAAVAVLALTVVVIDRAAADDGGEGESGGPIQTLFSKVAGKLGVSEERMDSAVKDASLEMIDEALAEGQITEEQAGRLRERVEEYGFALPLRPRWGHGVCQARVHFLLGAAGEVLDTEKGDLLQELRDGKTLVQLAEGKGMSVEQFKSDLLAQIEADLNELVEEGKITQERADKALERAQDNIDDIVSRQAPEHPCRGGPEREGFRGDPPVEEEPTAELPQA